MTDLACLGCAHCQRRFCGTTPREWCKRYHRPAVVRCLDYLKRSSIK